MASKKTKRITPNPNLWAVSYSVDDGTEPFDQLWILAPNMQSAITKAKTHVKKLGLKRARIIEAKWEGTIDAF